MKEQWRPVREFEGVYEVSDLGNVRRIKRSKGTLPGRIITPHPTSNRGYLGMHLKDGKNRKGKLLHIMVAEAFIPNPSNLPQVNHKGPKSDCRAIMLEWRSFEGNTLDAMQRGLLGNGKDAGVCLDKRRGKWAAKYHYNGKHVWLGYFATRDEALKVRRAAVAALPYIL